MALRIKSELPPLRNGLLCDLEPIICSQLYSPNPRDRDIIDAVCLAPTGYYNRRPPLLIDTIDADKTTKEMLDIYTSVLTQWYRSILLVSFRNATVTGQGALVTASNYLITDTVVEYTAQAALPDGILYVEGDKFQMSGRVDRRIETPSILVKRPWYFNFGHWLADGATILAISSEIIKWKNLTIIVGENKDQKMRSIVEETIAKLAPGAEILMHPDTEVWEFEKLFYVSPPHVPPLFKLPEAIRRLRGAFLSNAPISSNRKLFVRRCNARHRTLINEDEISEMCAKRGFELVVPERMSLGQQAQLFSQARAIIAVKGAALTNCRFCMPGTKVIALSPADFPDPFYWDIVGQIDCDYAEVFGPTATKNHNGLNEFSIDCAKLTGILDALNT